MSKPLRYELWDGKAVLGHYISPYPIGGEAIIIADKPLTTTTTTTTFTKALYSRRTKTFKVPIGWRLVEHEGTQILFRQVLDVRRKSSRQIEILKKSSR